MKAFGPVPLCLPSLPRQSSWLPLVLQVLLKLFTHTKNPPSLDKQNVQDYQVATDKNPTTPTMQLDAVQYFPDLVFHFERHGRTTVPT